MSPAVVLISGSIVKGPEQRHTNRGKPFTVLTLKVAGGNEWWSVSAFSENVQGDLAELSVGDGLAVVGILRAETYERDGQQQMSLGVTAGRVLTLRASAEKGPKAKALTGREVADASWAAPQRRGGGAHDDLV